ncbi:unnamed protein product [Prorocentrum cordatum]|uniref:Uncharacterized protein n=1 Tax=Prorocentrum cordatum TaxID=2364126 RepID=A0ABN9U1B3_9DINO|nr:unnamed protein product [Polarella glacialis]
MSWRGLSAMGRRWRAPSARAVVPLCGAQPRQPHAGARRGGLQERKPAECVRDDEGDIIIATFLARPRASGAPAFSMSELGGEAAAFDFEARFEVDGVGGSRMGELMAEIGGLPSAVAEEEAELTAVAKAIALEELYVAAPPRETAGAADDAWGAKALPNVISYSRWYQHVREGRAVAEGAGSAERDV